MARVSDKIQLPTNTTDISTLVRYLKEIKNNEPLNNNTAQPFYQGVKEKGKKSKSYTAGSETGLEISPKAKDTHTTGTLSTYGLIDYIDSKKPANFIVSALGNKLIEMYDDDGNPLCDATSGERLYCDEEYTIILLRVFSAWHETGNGRDIHPGRIILQLMCEEKLDYYLTEHDVAYFTCNPDFKTDDQYEEIKDYIVEFREKYDGVYGFTKTPCKAEIFMPTFVRNWHIFEKESVYDILPDISNPGHFILKTKDSATDDGGCNVDEEADVTDDFTDDETTLSGVEADGTSEDELDAIGMNVPPKGLGTSIDLTTLYTNLTHYVLTKGASVYCGIVFGFSNKAKQIVYFGAPGTGKSHSIDEKLDKAKIDKAFQSRVIFYPDYTYGDFVGCLRPKKDKSSVDYQFIPGPLTKAVMTAFENPKNQVYMIIEEINRGSAAAIFGDLFQLLDRDEKGKSKYVIRNEDMCSIFTRSPLLKPFFTDGNVWFPSNFNLLCTMNTADQNVFVLDSAFKRRFHMQYVEIDYDVFKTDKKLEPYLAETDVFAGTEDLVTMFAGTEVSALVAKMDTEGILRRNWPTFATLVNATIDIINKNEGDQISEDKKLGPFYVLLDELDSRDKFADKVLYYLKQDVFKYVDTYFVISYQNLYRNYKNKTIDVFRLLIPGEN